MGVALSDQGDSGTTLTGGSGRTRCGLPQPRGLFLLKQEGFLRNLQTRACRALSGAHAF